MSPTGEQPTREVAVVIGTGGMGQAIARREGCGRRLVLADFDTASLERFADVLRDEGFDVTTAEVDVADRASVASVAALADGLGPITRLVHTAGVSPIQAPASTILAVDLLGTAFVLAEFERVVAAGGAGVVISSMSGHFARLNAEDERALAVTPAEELLELPVVAAVDDPKAAYPLSKRANQLRVQAAATTWGARGARINSISPGVISTPMARQELASEHGDRMRTMIDSSGAGRIGTTTDIADAASFLLGPAASFITGTDLLVDGGVVAATRQF
ncbi:SDR family oxidoreductase [Saccharopolyspora gloriosae]|uniref:NAD(P)-dependent dehydrogenase (Short-subunit alcohol dehydrogenase family) n=1 Tax=Saccharopolyspora gloriosae TaxID=455344 RepID=A0A840NNH8_9PSEU|nr:SDR family oxidoreductase [Saccharopolyspora gloriosae]MBB5070632.1 NAD(P)-dependent dehydrogenase (short-subunit alcohol dehydrogenase family) [Saccharopolyspora gloriosae]